MPDGFSCLLPSQLRIAMPHVKMPHPGLSVPHIIGTSVRDPHILVRPSPASYTTYRDRTRFFYCAISCWPCMVCVKKDFPLKQLVYVLHGTAIAITVTNTIDSRAYLTTVCCQEKWSGKYLTYRTGGYGPVYTLLFS